MITIITEKPVRSIQIKGYGVDSYIDSATNKKVYRVYGVVEAGTRARLVPRDSEDPKDIKDLYIDDAKIIIYRNENKDLCMACKGMIDGHIARGIPVFGVEQFKQWVEEQKEELSKIQKQENGVDTDAN